MPNLTKNDLSEFDFTKQSVLKYYKYKYVRLYYIIIIQRQTQTWVIMETLQLKGLHVHAVSDY